ncbi:Galactose oxidase/kelch repeat superfamily protein [Prunus dulcis]|uniref:Galactose oxidase/kelch repeat superfamily protein n=1 Tax=Prunus dulcis TaxID=3755 RepID=A0A4Y1R0J7_PRUDU|nr:Galactose oxidase/kelch repeat superfamily protein [Prunus dulcis]
MMFFCLLFLIMEGETSWFSHSFDDMAREIGEFDSFSELSDEGNKEATAVSVDLILPDDLLERILACLPVASIFRARCVCKGGMRFSNEPTGYAYDPILRKWYGIELPCIETSNWFIASSCGLVCFMDNDSRTELYVCNPITKTHKKLRDPPGLRFSDYSALAVSVNRKSHGYTISIVKSKQVTGNFFQWDVSVHIYDSETMRWVTTLTEVLTGWRGGDESVICDGVLYFLIYSTGVGHRKIVTEKLVMVGGIGKQDRPDIIKGIGIWVLNGKAWQEIARMPHNGTDDLIYIQSYGAPALLVFDMSQRHWRWSQKCPIRREDKFKNIRIKNTNDITINKPIRWHP